MGQIPPVRLSSSLKSVRHTRLGRSEVQEHRPAGRSELAALGLVADRLHQARRARPVAPRTGWLGRRRRSAAPRSCGGPGCPCSACLAASGSIWSTTGAGQGPLPGRGRAAPTTARHRYQQAMGMPSSWHMRVTLSPASARITSRSSKPGRRPPLAPHPHLHVGFAEGAGQLLDLGL